MKKLMTCLLAMLGLTAYSQENYEVDVFKTKSGKEVKFHALVHASIRIEYDGCEIMVDPVTKLGNKTINYAAMPKVLFPYHYGRTDVSTIPSQLKDIDVRIRHYE